MQGHGNRGGEKRHLFANGKPKVTAAVASPTAARGTASRETTAPPHPAAARPRDSAHLGSARYGYTFRRALFTSDLLGLAAGIALTHLFLSLSGRGGIDTDALLLTIAFVPLWVGLAQSVDLYHLPERRVDHSFADEFGPIFLITTVWIWLYAVASAPVLPGPTELLGPAVLWLTGIATVLIARSVARRLARDRAWYRRAVLLVGDREDTDRVLKRIQRHPEWGLRASYRLLLGSGSTELEALNGSDAPHSRKVLTPEPDRAAQLAAIADELDVDRVILTGTSASLTERTHLARLLTETGHCVDYVYGEPETLYVAAVLHQLEGLPVLSVEPTRLSRGSAVMKRGLDILVSGIGLLLLAPLFAVVAVLIKLDSKGPVFFRQRRAGRDNREFAAVKFRTMVDGADAMREDVRQHSIHEGNGMLKVRDDPRITRLGARLRRWSIDELPQLWNVLRGDMSLVGPRPLPLDEAPLVTGHFELRTMVRPGITGTWQTHGRSDIPFEDMVKLDYTYVAGWSMREDLRLLLRTVAAVAQGRGSY
jgi:exopolysaccharide biosynthesis polyprenyl glycosylphosphotransferase